MHFMMDLGDRISTEVCHMLCFIVEFLSFKGTLFGNVHRITMSCNDILPDIPTVKH